ncbi:MAG: tetratricopeptide repeat protein [Alphaproteobacteria bacterium]
MTLSGYTRDARAGIMAYKPAPIQVNYCGYPGSLGAPYIDYMIADRQVILEDEVDTFTEKLVWMPHHYQSADDKAAVSQRAIARAEQGLPEGRFVFMAYNTTNKITPQVFGTWMRILKRVEGSVIWLSQGKGEAVENLQREAQAHGINPDRLVFAHGQAERSEHIARHRLADLFLDTLPYNAHTTASDALWAGLPVMTCRGTTFPGRVCASILLAAGLPELITDNLADYEELAVSLANNPERLKAIRRKVEGEVRRSPLFDTAGYTRDLETAYRTMYEIHRAGEPPRSFAVADQVAAAPVVRTAPRDEPATVALADLSVDELIARGRAEAKADRLAEAEDIFSLVRDRDPSNGAALEGLGLIAARRRNVLQARTLLSEALKKDPNLVEASIALAPFLANAGLPNAALGLVERAAASHPDHAMARFELGRIFRSRGEHQRANEAFEQAVEIDPSVARILDTWSHDRLSECDWLGYDAHVALLKHLVHAGYDAAQPYVMMLMSDDREDVAASARAYATRRYPPKPALWTGERPKHDKIRLAYLTAEMSDHPVANLLAGVWEHHDHSRFEVSCISYGKPSQAPIVGRVRPAFDHFIEAADQDAEAIARLVHDRQIDIAVTLNGYTLDSRPEILAHRPAPIQVNYLGFPGTMGAPYIDYLIADRRVVAEDETASYDEKIVWMPNAYQPTDDAEFRPEGTYNRTEAGLPRNAFIFMAFNHSYKITPQMFDVWMRILKRVPHGVLWLADKNEAMRSNLEREAAARGIKPSRLIFAPRLAHRADHLARHRYANLFLDTLPYTAHATASDALWAGLPVLTCRGSTFQSRVCADFLTVAGVPELVTNSLAEYEALAISLANNPKRLAAFRDRVRGQAPASPLFDTKAYTRHLELAYQTMYDTWQSGMPPAPFSVV